MRVTPEAVEAARKVLQKRRWNAPAGDATTTRHLTEALQAAFECDAGEDPRRTGQPPSGLPQSDRRLRRATSWRRHTPASTASGFDGMTVPAAHTQLRLETR